DGGRMDNAITRSAEAIVAFPAAADDAVTAQLQQLQSMLRAELAGVDDGVTVSRCAGEASEAPSAADSRRLVQLLYALPFGVERMSQAAPGVVETSNNIGRSEERRVGKEGRARWVAAR